MQDSTLRRTSWVVDRHLLHLGDKLGLTFAPGKKQPNAASGSWDRGLPTDLAPLREHFGTNVLVSLTEQREHRDLGIADIASAKEAVGMKHIHFPVPKDEDAFQSLIERITNGLGRARTVVVHCRGARPIGKRRCGRTHGPRREPRRAPRLRHICRNHPSLADRRRLRSATEAVFEHRRGPRNDEVRSAVKSGLDAFDSGDISPEHIEQLGAAWVLEKALAIRPYCGLHGIRAGDSRAGVLPGGNHSGDSDSTGSIAGNLMGAAMGVDALPDERLAN